MSRVTADPRLELESDWALWLATLFPHVVTKPFGPHQAEFWDWLWSVQPDLRPDPRVDLWARGHSKTTSGELATVSLAARGLRCYGLYVTRTQELANQKVGGNIASLFEGDEFSAFYPEHADRAVTKFGHSRGWKVSRLRTAGGFTIDAIGLDAAGRGLKIDAKRPDWIWVDDVDDPADSQVLVQRALTRLSRNILPARSQDAVVWFSQNLVRHDGVFGSLLHRTTDMLADARVYGPVPAVRDLKVEFERDQYGKGCYTIIGGEATWPQGFDLKACQEELNTSGMSSFLAEHQHEPQDVIGDVFAHVDLPSLVVKRKALPPLDRIVCWLDPAVEGDGESAQGVIVAGRDRPGNVYLITAFEGRCGPQEALRIAVRLALSEGSAVCNVETTQGGDKLWRTAFNEAVLQEGARASGLKFDSHKPKRGKTERMTDVVLSAERGQLFIVEGTHQTIISSLRRFPEKPNDLADAIWHAHRDLTAHGGRAHWTNHAQMMRVPGVRPR